jgi:hypothetical protein
MTVKDVAKELKLDWHTVKALDKEYMEEQLRRNPVASPGNKGHFPIFKDNWGEAKIIKYLQVRAI